MKHKIIIISLTLGLLVFISILVVSLVNYKNKDLYEQFLETIKGQGFTNQVGYIHTKKDIEEQTEEYDEFLNNKLEERAQKVRNFSVIDFIKLNKINIDKLTGIEKETYLNTLIVMDNLYSTYNDYLYLILLEDGEEKTNVEDSLETFYNVVCALIEGQLNTPAYGFLSNFFEKLKNNKKLNTDELKNLTLLNFDFFYLSDESYYDDYLKNIEIKIDNIINSLVKNTLYGKFDYYEGNDNYYIKVDKFYYKLTSLKKVKTLNTDDVFYSIVFMNNTSDTKIYLVNLENDFFVESKTACDYLLYNSEIDEYTSFYKYGISSRDSYFIGHVFSFDKQIDYYKKSKDSVWEYANGHGYGNRGFFYPLLDGRLVLFSYGYDEGANYGSFSTNAYIRLYDKTWSEVQEEYRWNSYGKDKVFFFYHLGYNKIGVNVVEIKDEIAEYVESHNYDSEEGWYSKVCEDEFVDCKEEGAVYNVFHYSYDIQTRTFEVCNEEEYKDVFYTTLYSKLI